MKNPLTLTLTRLGHLRDGLIGNVEGDYWMNKLFLFLITCAGEPKHLGKTKPLINEGWGVPRQQPGLRLKD
jgi:hypothetical protein